ncbi:MAG: Cobalt-dependent inorganic pyrophosphatase [Firmicutes bacterium]|nr:Cobalt-dependent inorganic pyrophosphatase [Bacillota bacterium]
MKKPIYVIGHRNPDTDSICSAIGYAHLKNAMGENAVAARAGKITAETKFVLEYFNIPVPILIDDLYPQAKDIMTREMVTVKPGNTLRELGQIMTRYGVKSVPVVDDLGMLAGMVTVGDLSKRYFDELEMQDLQEAGVDYAGLLRTLDGVLVTGEHLEKQIAGKVRIGGARTITMSKSIQRGDIVLVGDRETTQLAAIKQGIACLIVTGGAEITSEVRAAAEISGSIIIQVAYDTYTSARLINQSIPVRMIMQASVVGFKPTDLVTDIKNIVIAAKHRFYPVTEAGKLVGLIDRDGLIVREREQIILVDHNEETQAVEGIEEANIVEIVDHHRLGGLQTGEPIFIRHEPVGSTATIVANMHWHRVVDMPSDIAGLLLAAIISDTLFFRSPTSTNMDRQTAEKLAQLANLELEKFGMAVLKAGAGLNGLSPSDIAANDMKEFQMEEYRIFISQISVLEPDEVLVKKTEVLSAMEGLRLKEQADIGILLITDIIKEATYLLSVGQAKNIITQAFGPEGTDGLWYLPGVMSRKKQVVPPLLEAAKQQSQY